MVRMMEKERVHNSVRYWVRKKVNRLESLKVNYSEVMKACLKEATKVQMTALKMAGLKEAKMAEQMEMVT